MARIVLRGLTIEFDWFHEEKNVEFAQLMGMSDNLSNTLAKDQKVFKYIPFGNLYETLPYLTRRLYENYPMMQYLWK